MPNNTNTSSDEYFIDITDDVCPMTFVRTKLALEKVPTGSVLKVRLNSGEPLNNVPRSAVDHGHTVVSLVAEDSSKAEDGVHILSILKGE